MKKFLHVCTCAMALFAWTSAHAGNIARVGVSARDMLALDPAFGIGNGDEFAIRQIYSTLVSPPDGTSNIQFDRLKGELAERWEMSLDARHFTFHLRHGVAWQKGLRRSHSQ